MGILPLGVLLLLGLLACSTTKGSLLEKAAERDKKDSKVTIPREEEEKEDYKADIDFYEPEKPVKEKKIGLEIRSSPSGVRVYLGNRYIGTTPLVFAGARIGRYKLTLKKEGYYSCSARGRDQLRRFLASRWQAAQNRRGLTHLPRPGIRI